MSAEELAAAGAPHNGAAAQDAPDDDSGGALALDDVAGAPGGALGGGGGGGAPEPPDGPHVLRLSDVSGEAQLLCGVPGCGRAFKSRPNLAVHMHSHPAALLASLPDPGAAQARRGRFHCFVEGCPFAAGRKTLASLKSALQHFAQLHGAKKLACDRPGCGAQFSKAHQLNRHYKNAHAAAACACGVTFSSAHALNKHLKHFTPRQPGMHTAVAAGGAQAAGDDANALPLALPPPEDEPLAAAPPELPSDTM